MIAVLTAVISCEVHAALLSVFFLCVHRLVRMTNESWTNFSIAHTAHWAHMEVFQSVATFKCLWAWDRMHIIATFQSSEDNKRKYRYLYTCTFNPVKLVSMAFQVSWWHFLLLVCSRWCRNVAPSCQHALYSHSNCEHPFWNLCTAAMHLRSCLFPLIYKHAQLETAGDGKGCTCEVLCCHAFRCSLLGYRDQSIEFLSTQETRIFKCASQISCGHFAHGGGFPPKKGDQPRNHSSCTRCE